MQQMLARPAKLAAINLSGLPDALGPAGHRACSCGRTIRPAAQMARPKWLRH